MKRFVGDPILDSPSNIPAFLLQASGVTILYALGLRQSSLLATASIIPAVLMGATLLQLMGAFELRNAYQPALQIALVLLVIVGIVKFRLERPYLLSILFGGLFTIFVGLVKVAPRSGERASEDSLQIAVYAVEFLQKGLAPPLGDRGLALPLLLALAPEGQILIGLPLLFWLQLLGIVLLISGQLSREKPKSAVRIGAIIGTAAVVAALPITWVAATYINSHVLVALCLGVSVHLLVKGSKQFQIDRQDRILLILALASLSMARPDGLFFAFVVLIFLMGMPLQEGPRPKVWILVTMLVFSLVFSPGIELGSALGPSGSLFLTSTMVGAGALSWALRDYLSGFVISSIAMLLAVGALVTFFLQTNMDLVDAVSPQLRNLALGAGGWGLFFPLLIVLLVATQLGNTGRQRAHILDLLLSLVLVLVTLKILSGGGIGNQGFNDSINRSLLHFLPLLVPVTFVAIEELGVRISSVYSPRNRGENA